MSHMGRSRPVKSSYSPDRAGHDVVVASDGCNGLKAFESGQFDLLIADVFMPGMKRYGRCIGNGPRSRSLRSREMSSRTIRNRYRIFSTW
jgi:PleD family two-component response regulator